MHAVIKIIFHIDHIKNADNWVAAILDMQISKCNVISGYGKKTQRKNYKDGRQRNQKWTRCSLMISSFWALYMCPRVVIYFVLLDTRTQSFLLRHGSYTDFVHVLCIMLWVWCIICSWRIFYVDKHKDKIASSMKVSYQVVCKVLTFDLEFLI